MSVVVDHPEQYTEEQKAWLILRDRITELTARADAMRAALEAGPCTHPKVSTYNWQHDNGYGRQSMVVGHICDFCGARNSWTDANYWLTAAQHRESLDSRHD